MTHREKKEELHFPFKKKKKDFLSLFDRRSERAQAGERAEGEEEAGSLLSRELYVGLNPRTLE